MASDLTTRLGGARSSLAIKAPCVVATTANVALTGLQTIDGVAVVANDRVLVKDQTTGATNGIYVVKATAWERARDFSGDSDVVKGTRIIVAGGSSGSGTYGVTTANPITIGTTSLAFQLIDASSPNLIETLTNKTINITNNTLIMTAAELSAAVTDDDPLYANRTDNLTAGFTTTAEDAGTKSSGTFTLDPTLGNIQRCVNGGAFTLAPPVSDCSMVLKVTNNASAGTITTSGFTMVSGDAPGTVNADVYVAYVTVIDGFYHLTWVSGDGDIDLTGYLRTVDIGVTVQAYDADTLKADTADVLTTGFAVTPYNAGTKSSGTYTPDEANGNMQYAVNGGAHTLAPPTNNGTLIIQYTNNGSAGTVTTSGFTKVSGEAPTTVNGADFIAYITKINGFSNLSWVALQ